MDLALDESKIISPFIFVACSPRIGGWYWTSKLLYEAVASDGIWRNLSWMPLMAHSSPAVGQKKNDPSRTTLSRQQPCPLLH